MTEPSLRLCARALTAWACALVGTLSLTAAATSIPDLSIAERTQRSDRVVLATVESSRSEGDSPRAIRTVTTLRVAEIWKGNGSARIELVQLGGTTPNGLRARVNGDAEFHPGERVIVFLRCGTGERCTLFGLGDGKLQVLGDQVVTRSHDGRESHRTLAEVREEIAQAAKGEKK